MQGILMRPRGHTAGRQITRIRMILSAMLSSKHPDTHGRQSCDGNLKGSDSYGISWHRQTHAGKLGHMVLPAHPILPRLRYMKVWSDEGAHQACAGGACGSARWSPPPLRAHSRPACTCRSGRNFTLCSLGRHATFHMQKWHANACWLLPAKAGCLMQARLPVQRSLA